MTANTNRRRFLKHAATGGAGVLVLGGGAAAKTYAANEKLGVAIAGCAGRGDWFARNMPAWERIAAMCDVDRRKARENFKNHPDVPQFADFRKMLDAMEKEIDAVIVATPDNTHAVISLGAIERGIPVYCEKPLSLGVWESRRMRDAARKHGVATQMGNQGTASGGFRRSLELIRGGVLGRITAAHVWNSGGGGGERTPPEKGMPVPETLSWDLWLGPAAERPYHRKWMHWHSWRDFGTSKLGNWAPHTANLAFRALAVDALWYGGGGEKPLIRVETTCSDKCVHSFPKWEIIDFRIPARKELPPITIRWWNGSKAPGCRERLEKLAGRDLDWGDKGAKKWRDWAGTMIVGTEGTLLSNGHNTTVELIPADKFRDVRTKGPEILPRSRGHEREFFDAVRGGKPAWSNFDYAACLNEMLQVGNVSTLVEGPLAFDPVACRIVNNEQADTALRREYRKGWTV